MPLNLSQWDLKFLSPEEQAEGLSIKQQYANDPTQKDSLHTYFEGVRAKKGYSGGIDGSQYIPIDMAPEAPVIEKWESPNQGMRDDLYEQIKNPPKFEDPYGDLLNQGISNIMNRPKFSYDADSDPAYQAFIQRATRAGDKAYADNLGGMSAMTGGRPNSWAGTVASQARNEYTLQAQEAVIHFEERAYSRYKDETADMYNLVNLLNSQDEKAYSRFRDTVGDTKDLFDMVMKLDDMDFQNYKFMAEQQWKTFDTEYVAYKDALDEKKKKIDAALDRTNLTGFVNNEDSILLGVPTGTLSQGARERAEQMADYVTKQGHDLKQFKAEKEITHEFDLKLLKVKEQMDIAAEGRSAARAGSRSSGSGGGSSSGGSSSGGSVSDFKPTVAEAKHISNGIAEFDKLITSKDWERLSSLEKKNAIARIVDRVVVDIDGNMWGKNSMQIGRAIMQRIQSTSEYQTYYAGYIAADKKMKTTIDKIGSPTGSPSLFDAMRNIQK